MMDTPTLDVPPLYEMPSAADYAAAARRRRVSFVVGGLCLALLMVAAFTALESYDVANVMLPLALLICLATPILLWHYPRASLYVVLAAVCLFETGKTQYSDSLTDAVPFFWNINTIFEIYAHANPKAVPLNLLEVFLLNAGFCSIVQAIYTNRVHLRSGKMFVSMLAFMGFVGLGWFNGMATGGDSKIALLEVRSQFYLVMVYLMAVNIVRERRQINAALWIMVLCIGLKGILYTFRRYVTLGGQALPDQGVGSHEEAFLFNCFEVLLVILILCGVHKRLQMVMWLLLPFVITGNMATNRRAATAALIVVVPVLLLAAYRTLPKRRRIVGTFGLILAIVWPIYYQAFKNSESMYAQPARSVKSNFQPDARDASSNAARDAENANLMATIKAAPIQGWGYGRGYMHVVQMVDISQFYALEDFMPHNQILWEWMRLGTPGFLVFWLMVSAILIFTCQMIRNDAADAEMKAIGIFTLLVVSQLMMFGLLDLQLSNYRDMLFSGFWAGIAGSLALSLKASAQFPATLSPKAEAGNDWATRRAESRMPGQRNERVAS